MLPWLLCGILILAVLVLLAKLFLLYRSLDEIARLCGCTSAAARKRLSRARKLLAKRLEVAR